VRFSVILFSYIVSFIIKRKIKREGYPKLKLSSKSFNNTYGKRLNGFIENKKMNSMRRSTLKID
jgi:hypothetical protein